MASKQMGGAAQTASRNSSNAVGRQATRVGAVHSDGTYRMVADRTGQLRSVDLRRIAAKRRRRIMRGAAASLGRLVVMALLAVIVCAICWVAEYVNQYSSRFITPDEYLAVRICRAMPLVRHFYRGPVPSLHQYLAANIPAELLRQDYTLNTIRRQTVAQSLEGVARHRAQQEQARILAVREEQRRLEREARARAEREEQERRLLALVQQQEAQRQQLLNAEREALAQINSALNKPDGSRLLAAVPEPMRGDAAEYIYSHSERVAAIKQDPSTIGWADMPRIMAINAINDFFTSENGSYLRDGLPERGRPNPGEYLVAVAVHANTPSNYREDSPDRPGLQPVQKYLEMDDDQAFDQIEEDALEEAAGIIIEPLVGMFSGVFGDDDDDE